MTQPQFEKTADEFDRASEIELHRNQGLVDAARLKAKQRRQPEADGSYADTECDECGDEIGSERMRLAPNNHWCIDCATLAERFQRR